MMLRSERQYNKETKQLQNYITSVLWNKEIRKDTKIRIYNTTV